MNAALGRQPDVDGDAVSLTRPMSLDAAQRWLQRAIIHGPPVMLQPSLGATADSASVVTPSRHLSANERVAIYHDAYRQRLVACLRDDYPALAHGLGETTFSALALAYVAAYPSCSPNLNAYGRNLSAFCRRRGAPASNDAPGTVSRASLGDQPHVLAFAGDLAELEWTLVEVVHARSPQPLSMATLASIEPAQWAGARLVPSPTLRVLSTAHRVNAYYGAWRQGNETGLPMAGREETAVFRAGATLWRIDLTASMALLLRSLVSGTPLAQALAALATVNAGTAAMEADDVMGWFRDWVAQGFFSDIVVAAASDGSA